MSLQPESNIHNDQKPSYGLKRTTSRGNLLSSSSLDLKSMGKQPDPVNSITDDSGNKSSLIAQTVQRDNFSGLRRSKSQLHMGNMSGKAAEYGSSTNLASLLTNSTKNAKEGEVKSGSSSSSLDTTNGIRCSSSNSSQDGDISQGGLGLRRTGSKMSLSEATNKTPTHPPSTSQPRPVIPRSESTGNLKDGDQLAGSKAVESITGKFSTHLQSPSPDASPNHKIHVNQPLAFKKSSTPSPSLSSPSSIFHYGGVHDDASAKPIVDDRVDYFTHNWKVSDIAGSWRYVVSRRQDMANSARLENASWRMWAKARNNLRTIDPAQVNWLKDYDVSWLYGPLYHESDTLTSSSSSNTAEQHSSGATGDVSSGSTGNASDSPASSSNPGLNRHPLYNPPVGSTASPRATIYEASKNSNYRPKSILKKKSLAQIMLAQAQELDQVTHTNRPPSAKLAATNYLRHHNYRHSPQGNTRKVVASILNRQYNVDDGDSHDISNDISTQGLTQNENQSGASPHLSRTSSSSSTGSFHSVSLQPTTKNWGLSQENPSRENHADPLAPPTSASSMKTSVFQELNPSDSLASSRANSWTSSRASSRANSQIGFLAPSRSSVTSFRDSLGERHVHFNDRVEQCIALDPEFVYHRDSTDRERAGAGRRSAPTFNLGKRSSESALNDSDDSDDDDDDDDDEDDDDDDDDDEASGGGLFLGLRRPSALDLRETTRTIAALPATTLNYRNADSEEEESESEGDEIDSAPFTPSRRPGFNAQYKPHPVQTYQIVDPEVHAVAFKAAKGENKEK